MILIQRLQKYRLYHQAKLMNMNILLVKKYCPLIGSKYLNKLNLFILLWEKFFEKQAKISEDQGEKQIKAIQDNKEQSVNINNDNYKGKLLLSKKN